MQRLETTLLSPAGHGGDRQRFAAASGRQLNEILDFSANINPLGPPPALRMAVNRHLAAVCHYPDPEGIELRLRLAARLDLGAESIVLGNGASDLIFALPRALPVQRVLVEAPGYIDYERAARAAGLPVEFLPLAEEDGFRTDPAELAAAVTAGDLVFLGHPNNPCGTLLHRDRVLDLILAWPDVFFVIDESFVEFVEDFCTISFISRQMPENLVVVRSMTKFYGIPGLRLGFAAGTAPTMDRLRSQLVPWSVNSLALAAGVVALDDLAYARCSRDAVREARKKLTKLLEKISGLKIFPGVANYLLLRLDTTAADATLLADLLLRQHGIAIRPCANYAGLDQRYFRVAVRTTEENQRLAAALADFFERNATALKKDSAQLPRPAQNKPAFGQNLAASIPPAAESTSLPSSSAPRKRRQAKKIMVQGTTSNAGKSVLVAALCRILLQDGLRVAPFKAQNMSLNSYVTRDGGEMGRAQVVQAQACRLDPEVRMNPVLLKPSSDTGSQVIVNGRPIASMQAARYFDYKTEVWPKVTAAFDALSAEFDAVVLEGAGSPAEVNLKRRDIVNMRMARYAQAPVLLAGDIDRGGLFASFIGTMDVFEEWERQLVKGFIVNRFRGDRALLGDAYGYVENFTGVPVVGTVPHIRDLGLPEEDSVSFKAGLYDPQEKGERPLEIAVLDLPHISNFTDIEPFLAEPDVRLQVVRRLDELHRPDALILPGSKNVIYDLDFLESSGFSEAIRRLAATGSCEIVGICGGYQMLGRELADPHGLESTACAVRKGLGLLAVRSVLELEKNLRQVEGVHNASGCPVRGYEIHHGVSAADGRPALALTRKDGQTRTDGAESDNGLVWGSYLHGIFDSDPFRRWFLDRLRQRKGMAPLGEIAAIYDIEPALDRLAATVRKSLDMNAIYRMLEL